MNIREAIDLLLEVMTEHGDAIPEDHFDTLLVAV